MSLILFMYSFGTLLRNAVHDLPTPFWLVVCTVLGAALPFWCSKRKWENAMYYALTHKNIQCMYGTNMWIPLLAIVVNSICILMSTNIFSEYTQLPETGVFTLLPQWFYKAYYAFTVPEAFEMQSTVIMDGVYKLMCLVCLIYTRWFLWKADLIDTAIKRGAHFESILKDSKDFNTALETLCNDSSSASTTSTDDSNSVDS